MAILYYGFFPSNSTPTYQVLLYLLYLPWRYLLWRAGMLPGYLSCQVFRETAAKLQGMIAFGECFDAPIQKKFMGAKASKSVVQVVKADKRERKLTYDGPLAVQRMTRWVATHSLALVQDLNPNPNPTSNPNPNSTPRLSPDSNPNQVQDLTTESSIEAHMARGVPVSLLHV